MVMEKLHYHEHLWEYTLFLRMFMGRYTGTFNVLKTMRLYTSTRKYMEKLVLYTRKFILQTL